jgi:hypothetical protein
MLKHQKGSKMQIKKITLAALLAACVTGLCSYRAYAQINVNGGADMVFVPMQMVARDTVEDSGNIWLGSGISGNGSLFGIRTRLNLSAAYEEIAGFRTDIWFLYTNNGANLWEQPPGNNPNSPNTRNPNALDIRLGDFGEVWWKPNEWLRFNVGRFVNDDHTGYIDGCWLSAWTIGMLDAGNIFSYAYSGGIGFLARLTPPQIEGLSVNVFVPQFSMGFSEVDIENAWPGGNLLTNGADRLNDSGGGENINRNSNRAFRVFQRSWLTVGYEFSEAFHARLQYIGANSSGMINWTDGENIDVEPHKYRVTVSAPRIEAAFAWYGIKGFLLDIGIKSWLPVSDWITDTYDNAANNYIKLKNTGTYWGGIGFGLGVSFYELMDKRLVVNLRADGDMLRSWDGYYEGAHAIITNPLRLSFHVWPSYKIEDIGTFIVSAGVNYIGRNKVDIGGTDPNKGSPYWNDAYRLRFGGGLSFEKTVFKSGSISAGLAYSHGTSERYGGEPRVITIPINFFYHW